MRDLVGVVAGWVGLTKVEKIMVLHSRRSEMMVNSYIFQIVREIIDEDQE